MRYIIIAGRRIFIKPYLNKIERNYVMSIREKIIPYRIEKYQHYTPNIGYMTLTGLCDLWGAFSHDRYVKLVQILSRRGL